MSAADDKRRKALGKGIGALIAQRSVARPEPQTGAAPSGADSVLELSLDEIDVNPLQPRTEFDSQKLEELAQSIRVNGIIQPLVVRKAGRRYELVAGERRYRASRLAELATVPVVVRDIPDDRLLEVALIENIQREDLNPIEVARAYDKLVRELEISHEEVGRRTGKNRVTVTNMLRLLKLPPAVQDLVATNQLQMGHARALLALPDPDQQAQLAQKTVHSQLSVRQVEKLVNDLVNEEKPAKEEPPPPDPNVAAAIEQLEMSLGTKVRVIEKRRGRGRLEIEYYSVDDLNRIYQRIVGE